MFTALPPWPTPTPPAWLPPWPPPWPPPLPTPFSRLSDYCCRTLSLKSYHLSGKELNFLARMINGNRKQHGHGIKLLHWNKGPSFLHNKHMEVESIISDHEPHLLGLSEANLRADYDLSIPWSNILTNPPHLFYPKLLLLCNLTLTRLLEIWIGKK